MDKICSICKLPKPSDEFHKRAMSPDGLNPACKICRSKRRRYLYACSPSHDIERGKRWKENNREKSILNQTRKSAKERGLAFELALEDIIIPKFCPVFNIPLTFAKGQRTDNSPSIDRIDSSKGYIKGNIRIISWRANDLKKNGTMEEFEQIVDYMKITLDTENNP